MLEPRTEDDDAPLAFADKYAAETALQQFFDTCSEAVAEGLIKDSLDCGILARMLEAQAVALSQCPMDARDGFWEGLHGDACPDQDFCDFMEVKLEPCGPIDSDSEAEEVSEPWGAFIAKELAKVKAAAEKSSSGVKSGGFTGLLPRCSINVCLLEYSLVDGSREVWPEAMPGDVASAAAKQMLKDGLQPTRHEFRLTIDPAQHLLNLMDANERAGVYEMMTQMLNRKEKV